MIAMRRKTSHPKPFNAQIVQQCLQPGVSMANVALRHGINANLVRKWIPFSHHGGLQDFKKRGALVQRAQEVVQCRRAGRRMHRL